MGQLAAAVQQQEIQAKRTQDASVEGLLKKVWPRIQDIAPKEMNTERLFQIAISTIRKNKKLQQCSQASLLSCLMTCSALGLEPSEFDGLGRAYLIPYKNECTFVLGYKGMLELARRSQEIQSISAHVVREGDEFVYSYGLDDELRHVPKGSENPITHAYMVAKFKDGGHHFEVMTIGEIEKVRSFSMSGKSASSPWTQHYEAMCLKTVIRRAFKFLPVSVESQRAAAVDDSRGEFLDQIDPGYTPEPIEAVVETVEEPKEDRGVTIEADGQTMIVDPETGEVLQQAGAVNEH